MGLFSWLFGKKKKDTAGDEPQRHFREERPSRSKKQEIAENVEAEKTVENDAEAACEAVEAPVEESADEAVASEILEDKGTKSVKVKGYTGAFDIKRSRDGRYVFNLFAANKMIVATSRVYSSSKNALIGINSVITNAERANVEDRSLKSFVTQPFPKWEIYIDREGKFRFRLRATNGTCILRSQGYTQKSTCKSGIESVIRTCKTAKIDKSYLKKD